MVSWLAITSLYFFPVGVGDSYCHNSYFEVVCSLNADQVAGIALIARCINLHHNRMVQEVGQRYYEWRFPVPGSGLVCSIHIGIEQNVLGKLHGLGKSPPPEFLGLRRLPVGFFWQGCQDAFPTPVPENKMVAKFTTVMLRDSV